MAKLKVSPIGVGLPLFFSKLYFSSQYPKTRVKTPIKDVMGRS